MSGQYWCLLCVVSSSLMIVSHVNIDLGSRHPPQNGLREAELTDWKDNRHFRLVAVDQGLLAWRDLAHSAAGAHWPAVLVTWPPSAAAAHRAGDREPLYLAATATHVRVLAWSHVPVTRVTATLLATGQLLELRR